MECQTWPDKELKASGTSGMKIRASVMADYHFIMNHADSGRDGTIDYYEGGRSVAIYWEVLVRLESGPACGGVSLYMGLKEWANPKGVKIDKEHRLKILYRLCRWLKEQDIRSNVDLPSEIETVEARCMWRDCAEQRIKGSVFCMQHYDLNLLNSLPE